LLTSSATCCSSARQAVGGLGPVAIASVSEFIRSQRGWLGIEGLSGYVPELNPVEYLWCYRKHHELPSFCANDVRELKIVGSQKAIALQDVSFGIRERFNENGTLDMDFS